MKKQDIRFATNSREFDVRVAGILERNGKILVSNESDGNRTSNGGTVQFNETSEASVIREFKEETGQEVQVGRLLAVVENFFTIEEVSYQQIIFVYMLSLVNPSEELPTITNEHQMSNEWVALDQLDIKPSCLNELLKNYANIHELTVQHIVNYG